MLPRSSCTFVDSRFSPSVTGPRPTATSSTSAVTVFDSPCAVRKPTSTPLGVLSAASVRAPTWIVICLASTLCASAEISSSSSGRIRGSISSTVTLEPKRAKTDANSIPTAPAPITIRVFGISLSCSMSSEVRICLPSGAIPGRLFGFEPVAISTFLVLTFVSPASDLTTTVRAPSSRPWPLKSVILFFLNR